jgi:hypothetical protein
MYRIDTSQRYVLSRHGASRAWRDSRSQSTPDPSCQGTALITGDVVPKEADGDAVVFGVLLAGPGRIEPRGPELRLV